MSHRDLKDSHTQVDLVAAVCEAVTCCHHITQQLGQESMQSSCLLGQCFNHYTDAPSSGLQGLSELKCNCPPRRPPASSSCQRDWSSV